MPWNFWLKLTLFGKFATEIKTVLARHGFHYLLIIFIALIGIGTLLSYSFDQNLNSGANSLTNGLWLAVVNAFSGGFANVYPESPESKAISIFLILVGTVIVSYFTASLASYFTEKTEDIEQERIEKKLDNLLEKVEKLALLPHYRLNLEFFSGLVFLFRWLRFNLFG